MELPPMKLPPEGLRIEYGLRAENWAWPPRRDAPGVAGPEPVRLAFRRFLAGGLPYHRTP